MLLFNPSSTSEELEVSGVPAVEAVVGLDFRLAASALKGVTSHVLINILIIFASSIMIRREILKCFLKFRIFALTVDAKRGEKH